MHFYSLEYLDISFLIRTRIESVYNIPIKKKNNNNMKL